MDSLELPNPLLQCRYLPFAWELGALRQLSRLELLNWPWRTELYDCQPIAMVSNLQAMAFTLEADANK